MVEHRGAIVESSHRAVSHPGIGVHWTAKYVGRR
jgi:hypothetical protein